MSMAFQVLGDERKGFSSENTGKDAKQFCLASYVKKGDRAIEIS